MTKKNTNKEEVAKNAIDEEESLDLDELQSVFTEDGDESIDSSDETGNILAGILYNIRLIRITGTR